MAQRQDQVERQGADVVGQSVGQPPRLDEVEGGLCRFLLPGAGQDVAAVIRSEEHTSELQSLMRISYAVFCLKQKIASQQTHTAQRKIIIVYAVINMTMH